MLHPTITIISLPTKVLLLAENILELCHNTATIPCSYQFFGGLIAVRANG
jgi:hypothetical protein